jgi:hypothetical protein
VKDSDLRIDPKITKIEDNYDQFWYDYFIIIVRRDAYIRKEVLQNLDELIKNTDSERQKDFINLKNS